ncbi:hypothetical protein FEM33_17875 [Dyadobacter flavalbus]|uniref:Lipoprotein n=1 Tax=Dyadobacter flavalbus TaxID=2579942 RepID=A0A5M8QU28_9BACT|nr:hypothetical protein [Dyadobacter flavalbus]KAA6438550.1 hypothetical protein FEM33_17875 [Dyadobacter flavalbus]
MKALLISLTITILLSACNAITDPAPEDPLVPASVMQLVEKSFDNPENVVFTEILENKIWNVELESRAKKYNSVLSPNSIKVSYRLTGTDVPDSLRNLLNTSVIKGGTLSGFKQEEYISFSDFSYEKTYLADYIWKGKPYVLKWGATFRGGPKMVYDLEMSPFKSRFPTADLDDMPELLKQYFQKKGFQFLRATVFMDTDFRKTYQVWLHKTNADFQLLFDQDCNLIAGSDQSVRVDDVRELPENIRSYISSANANKDYGFEAEITGMSRSELDGVKSYVLILHQPKLPDNTDTWYILLDQNAKPLLSYYSCTRY